MKEGPVSGSTPLILLIDDEEWTTRSIQSVLSPEGYAVLMAYTGRQGLDLAAKVKPDLILVDSQLPDFTGIDLCARLREIPTVRPSTPILLFSSGSGDRHHRLDAYRAGAWGILDTPFDPQELITRILPLIQAKQDADSALESTDIDALTGFYNVHGLMRRLTEIGADTRRSRRPLACVVLGPSGQQTVTLPDFDDDEPERLSSITNAEVAQKLGYIIHAVTRMSDAVARVGVTDFVIIAPGTDRDGAIRLAERVVDLLEEMENQNDEIRELNLRAGLYAVSGTPEDAVVPEEVLRRATSALREVRSGIRFQGAGSRIFPFDYN